jgi:hypothetical protein
MSRGFKISLWILLLLVVAVLVYWPWSPGGRQLINMRIARKHLPQVEAIVKQDSRFVQVTVGVFTGQDGAIGFFGDVMSEEALGDLMKAVAKEKLQVPVAWRITVAPNS